MDLKECRIEYRINGQAGQVVVHAPSSIDGLLQWLETVPPTAGIKAIVKMLVPAEIVQ